MVDIGIAYEPLYTQLNLNDTVMFYNMTSSLPYNAVKPTSASIQQLVNTYNYSALECPPPGTKVIYPVNQQPQPPQPPSQTYSPPQPPQPPPSQTYSQQQPPSQTYSPPQPQPPPPSQTYSQQQMPSILHYYYHHTPSTPYTPHSELSEQPQPDLPYSMKHDFELTKRFPRRLHHYNTSPDEDLIIRPKSVKQLYPKPLREPYINYNYENADTTWYNNTDTFSSPSLQYCVKCANSFHPYSEGARRSQRYNINDSGMYNETENNTMYSKHRRRKVKPVPILDWFWNIVLNKDMSNFIIISLLCINLMLMLTTLSR